MRSREGDRSGRDHDLQDRAVSVNQASGLISPGSSIGYSVLTALNSFLRSKLTSLYGSRGESMAITMVCECGKGFSARG